LDTTTPLESGDKPTSEDINTQTGVLAWDELAKHFARGIVIYVEPDHDLVDVAQNMSMDQTAKIEQMLNAGSIRRASDDDARSWHRDDQQFWCVVVAPWVLVQKKDSTED